MSKLFEIAIQKAKEGFFDRKKIIGSVSDATKKIFTKFGAFVRTRSRSSIRKRKKPSAAGAPPSSHVGTLKNLIFFAYSERDRSVAIGPVLVPRSTDAPHTLEYGGPATITEHAWKFKNGQRVLVPIKRNVQVRQRAFMSPAFQAELPGLPPMWQNSVR